MSIAPDLKALLPKQASPLEEDDRPVYYLWTFDPDGNDGNGKVYLDHNEDKHPADHITHKDQAHHVHHPDAVRGYAYSIKDGWRITDDEHKQADHGVVHRVLQALRGEHPEPALPHIAYHRI